MNAPRSHAPKSREQKIFSALEAEYPKHMSAKSLMNRAGLPWRSDPVRSFTLLCIAYASLKNTLTGSGWQAERSGGAPDDNYWLSRVSGG